MDARTGKLAQRLNDLGADMNAADRLAEAEAALRRCVAIAPEIPEPLMNLSRTLSRSGKLHDAVAFARRAVKASGGRPLYRERLGMALLAVGNWTEGFEEFAARLDRMPEAKALTCAAWDGSPCNHLFVFAEQGFGDSIQMHRFVAAAAARARQVTIAMRPALFRLLSAHIPHNATAIHLPCRLPKDIDAWLPIMSLPGVLGLSPRDLSRFNAPYLHVEAQQNQGRQRVGLCWAGSATNEMDARRSVPLSEFQPLLADPRAEVVSLQVGPAGEQLTSIPPARFADFLDTATAIAGLDLVISCDTAVAHLAGAMGKPVWMLANVATGEWRWDPASETTPWYPSMRIFWRRIGEQWSDVVDRVRDALANGVR